MENTPLHLQELNSNQNMHIIYFEARIHHSRQYFQVVNSFLSHNISAEIVHLSYCNSIIMHRTTSIQSLALGHFTWAHITQVPHKKLCACISASAYTSVMIT
jgi:hypothetical protein